ncbi:copper chaperone PCu(A)C [Ruania alba]|uniref:Copper chaperone PCu(A)C n=1 Tax=Ruania alba TaxID=648782 RepID=A0A1H5BPN8_9MICO|nr:copper chaperone PCu(A)C [Ruania alba]SED56563.1 hypothetical protein SAMN04488554_0164 [Ruania alba]
MTHALMITPARRTRPFRAGAILTAALLGAGLAGCTSPSGQPTDSATESIEFADGWVAATDGESSAAYGTLSNPTSTEVTITAATSAAAGEMLLHEMVDDADGDMQMQEADGGFTLPPGGELLLEPGSTHLMMLDVPEPIEAGADITIGLELADGSTVTVTVPAKDVPAGEDYHPSESDESMEHEDS